MLSAEFRCVGLAQDVITDCSFVASLCIASAMEGRVHKRLITGIIYPQVKKPRADPSRNASCEAARQSFLAHGVVVHLPDAREPSLIMHCLLRLSNPGELVAVGYELPPEVFDSDRACKPCAVANVAARA